MDDVDKNMTTDRTKSILFTTRSAVFGRRKRTEPYSYYDWSLATKQHQTRVHYLESKSIHHEILR